MLCIILTFYASSISRWYYSRFRRPVIYLCSSQSCMATPSLYCVISVHNPSMWKPVKAIIIKQVTGFQEDPTLPVVIRESLIIPYESASNSIEYNHRNLLWNAQLNDLLFPCWLCLQETTCFQIINASVVSIGCIINVRLLRYFGDSLYTWWVITLKSIIIIFRLKCVI